MAHTNLLPMDRFGPAIRVGETVAEVIGLETGPRAGFATPNTNALDLKTVRLRDYSTGHEGVPILVRAL